MTSLCVKNADCPYDLSLWEGCQDLHDQCVGLDIVDESQVWIAANSGEAN